MVNLQRDLLYYLFKMNERLVHITVSISDLRHVVNKHPLGNDYAYLIDDITCNNIQINL